MATLVGNGVFPYVISPVSNISPFTYRDGMTYLELLYKIRDYMTDTLQPEFMAELDRIINEFNTGMADSAAAVIKSREDFDAIHAAFVDTINARVDAINEKTGPVSTQYITATGPVSITPDPLWPLTHPVNYEIDQDATGGRPVTLNNIDGSVAVNTAPNGTTRFTLYYNPAAGRWQVGQPRPVDREYNVRAYGALGIGVAGAAADTAGIKAAYAALKAAGGGTLVFGAGTFVANEEIDVYRPNSPRIDLVIRGDNALTTFLLANFYGAGKSLLKSRDPAGTTRSSPTSVYNMQFGTVDRNGANPVLLDIYGHGESRMEGIRFGSCNNMVSSIAGLQNVRYRDIVSFYGGKHYNYRNSAGITFSTTAGSNILTASADFFTGADVGRLINVYGTTPAKYLISTYTDARTVVLSGTTPTVTASNATAVMEPARITTTAGSNQVSANASVFTADDIGRVIYILGAKNGAYGESLLRGRITGLVSGLTVTLDVSADISKTRTEFGTPVMEFYSPLGLSTNDRGNNDFKVDLLHIENYGGIGLVMQNTIFGHINDMKIHGEQTPIDTRASAAAMWLDDCSGVISGELDGQATGDHRIYHSNMNDLLTYPWLASRRVNNARVFQIGPMTDAGGYAEVQSYNLYSAPASGDPYDTVEDTNTTPRLVFTGMVNMLGDALEPRIYKGKKTYFTMNGDMVTKSANGSWWKLSVSDTGVVSSAAVTP